MYIVCPAQLNLPSSQSTTPTDSSRPITELEVNVMKLKSELSAAMIGRDALKQEVRK